MSDYNEELCREKHLNLEKAISSLQAKMAFFNATSIGILVMIIVGLIVRHYGGK